MTYTPSTLKEKIFITNLSDYTLQGGLTADSTDNTIYFNQPVLDQNGNVPTSAMPLRVKNSKGEYERMKVVAGSFDEDGLSATVIRGIRETGLDWSTTDESLLKDFSGGDEVICPVDAVLFSILNSVIEGNTATGGNNLIIGNESSDEVTIKRTNDEGVVISCAKFSDSAVKFSVNGTDWIGFEDIVDGVTVKVNASDVTPKYLADAMQAGDNIDFDIVDTGGGNYKIVINSSSQREGVVEHTTYNPAYLTGGTNGETNTALWDNLTDGEFAFTLNGVLRIITGLNFTSIVTMADVAQVIEDGIRAVTGGSETCIWDTDHFVITSTDTTSSSAITVLTAGGGGTDISGSTWMDCDSGNGIVTDAVLNASADSGKVPLLKADGGLSAELITSESSVVENDFIVVGPSGGLKTAPSRYFIGNQNQNSFTSIRDLETADTTDGSSGGTGTYTTVSRPNLVSFSGLYGAGDYRDVTFQYEGDPDRESLVVEGSIRINKIQNGNIRFNFGVLQAITSNALTTLSSQGAMIAINSSGDYVFISRDGVAIQTTTLSISNDTTYLARVEIDSSSAKLYLNNVLVANHTTRYPSLDNVGELFIGFGVGGGAGITEAEMRVTNVRITNIY